MDDVLRKFPSSPPMDSRRILLNIKLRIENHRSSKQVIAVVECAYDRRVPLVAAQQLTSYSDGDLCNPEAYDKDRDEVA